MSSLLAVVLDDGLQLLQTVPKSLQIRLGVDTRLVHVAQDLLLGQRYVPKAMNGPTLMLAIWQYTAGLSLLLPTVRNIRLISENTSAMIVSTRLGS